MAAPQNFKVVGKGTAPATDDLAVRFKKKIEGAIEQGVMKAITSDTIIAGGELDETVLSQKIGKVDKDNPSGILARTKEYLSGLKELEVGYEDSMVYTKYRMTIETSALQNILIEEGVLSLPPAPKEEPPVTPPEQLPPKEEDKKDPPPAVNRNALSVTL